MSNLRILGTSDEQTVCDACGRTELKLTVIVADEDGEITGRYGTSCVDMVIGNGKGRRTTAQKAREIEACRVDALYTSMTHVRRDFAEVVKTGNGDVYEYAVQQLLRGIKAHNTLPTASTRKSVLAAVESIPNKVQRTHFANMVG